MQKTKSWNLGHPKLVKMSVCCLTADYFFGCSSHLNDNYFLSIVMGVDLRLQTYRRNIHFFIFETWVSDTRHLDQWEVQSWALLDHLPSLKIVQRCPRVLLVPMHLHMSFLVASARQLWSRSVWLSSVQRLYCPWVLSGYGHLGQDWLFDAQGPASFHIPPAIPVSLRIFGLLQPFSLLSIFDFLKM